MFGQLDTLLNVAVNSTHLHVQYVTRYHRDSTENDSVSAANFKLGLKVAQLYSRHHFDFDKI